MVGDVNQLSAVVSPEGKTRHYDRSLMERLIKLKVKSTILTVQRRMHPEILRFPNAKFYANKLTSEGTDHDHKNPYQVVHVDGDESKVGTSYENMGEADQCIKLALELKNKFTDVCILTPYLGQNRRIMARKSGIPVYTVDSFQGKEADVVVLSIVRTSNEGFWSDHRRLNVALTRAKKMMRVVCNTHTQTGVLADMVRDASERNCIAKS